MKVTVKDLTDIGDSDFNERRSEFLYCPKCGMQNGATRGDCFMLPKSHIFKCEDCGVNMRLARAETRIVILK